MRAFVDASALVSIAVRESDALELATILERGRERLSSPIAFCETVAAPCRRYEFSSDSARERVETLCELFALQLVAVGDREFELAVRAYARFGTGRHPAALDTGDCFAYACAEANRAELLFTGDDFGRTDIGIAGA